MIQPARFLLPPALIAFALLCVWTGMRKGNMVMTLLPAAMAIGVALINHPKFALLLTFILFPSGLILPGRK